MHNVIVVVHDVVSPVLALGCENRTGLDPHDTIDHESDISEHRIPIVARNYLAILFQVASQVVREAIPLYSRFVTQWRQSRGTSQMLSDHTACTGCMSWNGRPERTIQLVG